MTDDTAIYRIWGYWHGRGDPTLFCKEGSIVVLTKEETEGRPMLLASPEGVAAGMSTRCPCGRQAEWLHVNATDRNPDFFAGPFNEWQRRNGTALDGWLVEPWPTGAAR